MAGKKITKYDLVSSVYANADCEKKIVQEVVDGLLGQLKASLLDGSTIELRGFGTFELKMRKGRSKARNPKTGENVQVAPHYAVTFRPGKELKKSIAEIPLSGEN